MKSTKPSHNPDPIVHQGSCGITAELLKAGGACCTEWLTNIRKAWDTGSAHDDWKK